MDDEGRGGRELGRVATFCGTLRRKDFLFYLLPLSSPVLHSKKKDSEGGVIGRLLLFHENGGKRGAVSRKRERRKDRGFRVLEPQRAKRRPLYIEILPRRRSANTSCTPCGCYPSFVPSLPFGQIKLFKSCFSH